MAPHADSPPPQDSNINALPVRSAMPRINGDSKANSTSHNDSVLSMLQATSVDEMHDLICVGFGPASLAIAVALSDSLEFSDPNMEAFQDRSPKVAFLERQSHFAWHSGMQLPGAKMQISFMKDMATFRNPRSRYTFINYLFTKQRLAAFSNLSTFLPLRKEYEDYMKWCAESFNNVASYNQEAIEVSPIKVEKGATQIDAFVVKTRNLETQEIQTRRARHVVIAAGGRPAIPKHLPQNHSRVIHSSTYQWALPKLLEDHSKSYNIAVIGGGQSAAEIYNDLHTRYPNANSKLILRSSALKPSDDSPFVNEIFDPERVDNVYSTSDDIRQVDLEHDKSTNYGVVRLPLLEHIYEDLYHQRMEYSTEEDWPHRIMNFREVYKIEDSSSDKIMLHIHNDAERHGKAGVPSEERLEVDAVIIAAGYQYNVHEYLLSNAQGLMAGGYKPGKKWHVARDYKVDFEEGAVSEDAGVWLQGCNQQTHGLSDTLLSILASRGGEMVDAILHKGSKTPPPTSPKMNGESNAS